MTPPVRRLVLWAPRILGLAVAAFLALFALDVFQEQAGPVALAVALVVHLRPSIVLVVVLVAAWRHEWLGALAFLLAAAAYASRVSGHPDWILIISGPLALVGALYLLAWRRRHELDART